MTFDLQKIVRKNIRDLSPYSTARDEFQGIASVYLDANESPYNNGINRYPDPLQQELKVKISRIKNVHPHQIFLGNGSDEPIDLVFRAFCVPGKDKVISMSPTYGMYKVCADINDIVYCEVLLDDNFSLDSYAILKKVDKHTKAIFLCSPNNPTSNSLLRENIENILNKFNGLVVLDEAYIDFSEQESFLSVLDRYPNLIVLQTFSKAWGMAGIRIGMAFASKEIINLLNQIKYPYNVNVLSQQKALEMLENEEQKNRNVKEIVEERKNLTIQLQKHPQIQHIYPSDTNFLLIKVENAKHLYAFLMQNEIIVRDRSKVALCQGCLRITVGTKEENEVFLKVLSDYKPKSANE
jgi:histidinol-phosphate aminotransferase